MYRAEDIDTLLGYIATVATNWNWHTRLIASTFTHTLVFNNRFILLTKSVWVDSLVDLISSQLLQDEIIEVRESSRQTLRDFIKWEFIQPDVRHRLIDDCKAKSLQLTANEPVELIRRHSGILGLCAFIYAFASTELPDFLPDVVLFLARRVSDPQPIQKTVTTALRFFKKTHEPFWIEHKLKFTEEQLTELANVLISSSCFA